MWLTLWYVYLVIVCLIFYTNALYFQLYVCHLTTGFVSVNIDDVEAQQMFDDFFEEVFCDIEDKVMASS